MFQHLVTIWSSLHCSCTPLAGLVVPVWQHYTPVQSFPCDHPLCRRSRPLEQLHWWCSPGVPLMMASFSLHCRSGDPWLFFAKILIVKYLQKNSNFNFLRVVGLKIFCNFIKVMLIFFNYGLIFTSQITIIIKFTIINLFIGLHICMYMHYCALTINSSRAEANSPAPSYGWASEAPEACATPDIVLTASTSCW